MEPEYIKRERIKLTNIKIDNKRNEKNIGKMKGKKVTKVDPSSNSVNDLTKNIDFKKR